MRKIILCYLILFFISYGLALTEEEKTCDYDGDGFISKECGGDDCNDKDKRVNPNREEICDDGKDNDCDGWIDVTCDCPHPLLGLPDQIHEKCERKAREEHLEYLEYLEKTKFFKRWNNKPPSKADEVRSGVGPMGEQGSLSKEKPKKENGSLGDSSEVGQEHHYSDDKKKYHRPSGSSVDAFVERRCGGPNPGPNCPNKKERQSD